MALQEAVAPPTVQEVPHAADHPVGQDQPLLALVAWVLGEAVATMGRVNKAASPESPTTVAKARRPISTPLSLLRSRPRDQPGSGGLTVR